jgi:hypothetical protein
MPFVAATGTNYEDANSLVSVEYANDYHTLRGNTSWTGLDAIKQAALIKATDYIEQVYAGRWLGEIERTEGLSWPRYGAALYEYNVIPEPLKKAVCELALEALSGDLNPVISPDASVKREKVDVLETEYFEPKRNYKIRPVVSGLLAPLLRGSAFNVPLGRV